MFLFNLGLLPILGLALPKLELLPYQSRLLMTKLGLIVPLLGPLLHMQRLLLPSLGFLLVHARASGQGGASIWVLFCTTRGFKLDLLLP